jgi:cell division protein ZapA
MGQVSVTLNGRTYRLRCGEGEEARLIELAAFVRSRVEALAAEFGQVGDDRLLLMAAIMIADEYWDRIRFEPQGTENQRRGASDFDSNGRAVDFFGAWLRRRPP